MLNNIRNIVNQREQNRNQEINLLIDDIANHLVTFGYCKANDMKSNASVLHMCVKYIKEMEHRNNILTINTKNNNMERINFCNTQEEALKIYKYICDIWRLHNKQGWFFHYIDGNHANTDKSNLQLFNYADIFNLKTIEWCIDWDMHLTYLEVSFIYANIEKFNKLANCEENENIEWILSGELKHPRIYLSNSKIVI